MAQDEGAKTRVLDREITYDGEEYTRESLEGLVKTTEEQHGGTLKELEELRKAHDSIAAEMSRDIAKQKTAWECIKGMMTIDLGKVSSNVKTLLEKIPLLNDYIEDRPVADLLKEKIDVAERRTKEVGTYLDRLEAGIDRLRDDITRLNKKMIVAAHNEERAAAFVLELEGEKKRLEDELAGAGEKTSAYREKTAEIDEIKKKIWEHGGRLRLYSNAEDRLSSIIDMNNKFLEIMTNLHTNMTVLYETGTEVLDELRGNLTGLATVTEASELTLRMQKSLESMKESVNKVATLASNTSLYLTTNVERMISQMSVYDEATKALVESNLAAEREMKEQRINETVDLARREYDLLRQARVGTGDPAF
jgi:hypothetical protein